MNVSPKTRKALIIAAAATLLPVALLNAQLDIERAWRAQTTSSYEDMTLPSPVATRLLSLNYRTLAADIMWLALTTQHAEFVRYQSRASDNVLENAMKLAQTDPFFYQVYHWASGAFLNRRHPISDEDLHNVADLIEFGIDHHTTDPELRTSLALLFVGYGRGFTDDELVAQSKRALEQLDKAAQLSPDDLEIVGVRSFFRRRIAKYGGEVSTTADEPDVDFWFNLYMATNDRRIRAQAANELRSLGAYTALIQQNVKQLQREHLDDRPYLPIELWLLSRPGRTDG